MLAIFETIETILSKKLSRMTKQFVNDTHPEDNRLALT